MAQASWTLVSKIRPDRVADHARLVAERDTTRREFRSIGFVSRLLVPSRARRHIALKAQIAKLDREVAACVGPVGFDLDPPRIGHDDRATKWYRAHLAKDPDAWPLPPDDMVDEMKGEPVWELSKYPEVRHLDTGWPKGGFPVPLGPGLSMELIRRLSGNLSADQAVELAPAVHEAVIAYFRRKYPALAEAGFPEIVNAVVKGAVPGGPPGSMDPRDAEQANLALSGAQWLAFWGGHGYCLKSSAASSG